MGVQAPRTSPIALVVEDDADQRALAATLLEESDYRVVECETAEDALGAMAEHGRDVALVFMDVRLPGRMDGVTLAQRVDVQCPHAQLLVTSGAAGDRIRALPQKSLFMAKPWRPLDLLVRAEEARRAA
jgi:CheY-like chemotaxis protein